MPTMPSIESKVNSLDKVDMYSYNHTARILHMHIAILSTVSTVYTSKSITKLGNCPQNVKKSLAESTKKNRFKDCSQYNILNMGAELRFCSLVSL